MQYFSTRGHSSRLDSAEAILKGLAPDGGLFVPESLPQIDKKFITALQPLSYEERAEKVLGLFLTDYTADELRGCVARAYGGGKFDSERRAPVVTLSDASVLELWHGPTSAFQDRALQLRPQLMQTALQKTGVTDTVLILVATSGDTGKAALEGFRDVPQTKIMVFYPEGGVSRIQRLQMCTQEGANVNVTAVKGNFDDAQSGVKEIFGDEAFNGELQAASVRLSSANSINWGRLVPQIVYYFSAYADLVHAGTIALGEEINCTVPTGNFGDILAGFYARQMGLPIHHLVCASNANNVLTEFLRTGVYNRQRTFYKTITPSMDILISSNLERLLYHMTGSTGRVAEWMQQLQDDGCYTIGSELLSEIQRVFWADWVDDAQTKATICDVYEKEHYVCDPHTAVAYAVARRYQQETGDTRHMVVASTASPYKFNGSVLEALGAEYKGLDEFALLAKLAEYNDNPVPGGLAALARKEIRHQDVCGKADMRQAVLTFARQ